MGFRGWRVCRGLSLSYFGLYRRRGGGGVGELVPEMVRIVGGDRGW